MRGSEKVVRPCATADASANGIHRRHSQEGAERFLSTAAPSIRLPRRDEQNNRAILASLLIRLPCTTLVKMMLTAGRKGFRLAHAEAG
jgi:hypothetical protein